jgi:hypothetical protein
VPNYDAALASRDVLNMVRERTFWCIRLALYGGEVDVVAAPETGAENRSWAAFCAPLAG